MPIFQLSFPDLSLINFELRCILFYLHKFVLIALSFFVLFLCAYEKFDQQDDALKI